MAFASTLQAAAALGYQGEEVPWTGLLKARLVGWYLCALLVPFLVWLVRIRPIDRSGWRSALPLHAAAGLAAALAKEAMFVAIGNWFRPGVFRLPEILAGDYLDEVLLFWTVTALLHLYIQRQPKASSVAAEAGRNDEARSERFVIRTNGGYRLVSVDQVDWIDAQGNYARLHTPDGTFLVRETMAALERRLAGRFQRVHRRAIVNLSRVERAERRSHGRYRLILASGEAVETGRAHGSALRALFG